MKQMCDRPYQSRECPRHEVYGRDVSALLNPRPVCLIGAYDDEGRAGFATIAWITPISHTPPLLAFSLRESSSTFQLVRKAGLASVNVLGSRQTEAAWVCGTQSGRYVNKDTLIPHEPFDVDSTTLAHAVPFVSQALSNLACEVCSITETGDHMLVCMRVLHALTRTGFDEEGRAISPDTLLCLQSDAFTVASIGSQASKAAADTPTRHTHPTT